MKKLSECRSNIDDQLRRWHLSQHIGSVQEHELILNRSGLPHDLASKQLKRLWICAKYRHEMGKNWHPCWTCQYPLHSGRKKELKTRNALNIVMSREINTVYGNYVPMESRRCGELTTQLHISNILSLTERSLKVRRLTVLFRFFFNLRLLFSLCPYKKLVRTIIRLTHFFSTPSFLKENLCIYDKYRC